MRKAKQLQFEGFKKIGNAFGGSLLKGNPKTKRPLDSKLPVLLTLRATKSGMRLHSVYSKVNNIVAATATKYGVKIYEYANVGNHLHILLKIPKRATWSAFIRELSGAIATLMKRALNVKEKFWLYRPHTRLIQGWKKAYRIAKDYVYLNHLEGEGHIRRKDTRNLKDLRAILAPT